MKMKDVDQTHPDTNRAFGFTVYTRAVIADGGRETPDQTMADVEHEPPTDGAHRSFERGTPSAAQAETAEDEGQQ